MFLSLVVMVVVGARCFSLDSVLSSLADIFGDWFQIAFSAIYVTLWKFEKNEQNVIRSEFGWNVTQTNNWLESGEGEKCLNFLINFFYSNA